MLTVVVHRSEVSHGLREKCSILIDVLDVGDRSGADVEAPGRMFILEEAPELARRLCEEILASRFVIRVDFPPDSGITDPVPAIVKNHADLSVLMGLLKRHATEKLLYPIAFWAFSSEREPDLNRIVDAFYSVGRDSSLFDDAVADGAMRLAAFPSSLTLSLRCSDLGLGEEWVRRAMESSPLEARWQTE